MAGVYNRATYEREVTGALVLLADHVRSIVEHGERKTKNCAAQKTCMSGVDGERKFVVDGCHGYGSQ